MLIDLTLKQIAKICHGHLIGEDALVSAVVTDTREALEGALFVALKGDLFDGHEFVHLALEKGASAVLVEQDVAAKPAIIVENTLSAYTKLAHFVRQQFTAPVIAITGSNGKTTVKDWLSQILASQHQVLKTAKNNNNQIGVPKTLLQLSADHTVAIIEAGTSFPGEIAAMAAVLQPDIAIITNASGCHFEGFGTIAAIAKEKGALLTATKVGGLVILNADDASFAYWKTLSGHCRIKSFGFASTADLQACNLSLSAGQSLVTFVYEGKGIDLLIGSPGKHQVYNALAVTLALLEMGMDFAAAVATLAQPLVVPGRLEMLRQPNQPLLINDCYNASPKSVEAAIDVLVAQDDLTPWLVLGGLGELAALERDVHESIGRYAYHAGVQKLIALGPVAAIAAQEFSALGGDGVVCQIHTQIAALIKTLDKSYAVLVKGSRSAKMEKVIEELHY